MLKFTENGRLCGCFFGIGEAIAAVLTDVGIGAGTAAAAAPLVGETVVSTAPAIAGGLTAADVLGGTAALGSVLAPSLASAAPAAAAGATGTTTPVTPPAGQTTPATPSPVAPGQAPLSPAPNALGSPTGGPGASATSTVAPPSVPAQSPDVTQIQSAGSDLSTGSTSSPLPGNVGQGAATGTPTNTAGITPAGGPSGSSAITPATSSATPPAGGAIPGGETVTSTAPGTSTSVTPPATGPTTSVGKFIDNPTLKGAGDVLSSNPTTALSVAGLGLDFLRGQQKPPGYGQILNQANTLSNQAGQLEGYLSSGNLPPGIQSGINAATQAAEASIRSQYASRGMSGSSAEAQDISAAKTAGATQAADTALKLYNQGVSESNISAQLYGNIMNEAVQQDNEFANAISNFSYAMAGSGRPIILNTGSGT